MFNLSFIYFDFLHHLLSEIKEKKLYVFLQHFVYQQYIEVKDAANWMLCVHWKVCLNIAHNDWTINFAVPFPQYWHSKCNRFTAVAFLQFTCQLFNVNIISSLLYFFLQIYMQNPVQRDEAKILVIWIFLEVLAAGAWAFSNHDQSNCKLFLQG